MKYNFSDVTEIHFGPMDPCEKGETGHYSKSPQCEATSFLD